MSAAPHLVVPNFLAPEVHASILKWTLGKEDSFAPAQVFTGVDEERRRALVLSDLGPFAMPIASAASRSYRAWIQKMGLPPFDVSGVELELAAHNNGAHFHRHVDTQTMPGSGKSHRALSAVYYFYREPKAFSGGALHIYPLRSIDDEEFVAIAPAQNTLVVFPSSVPHQVMRVTCPTHAFPDSRFAVNCWLHIKSTEDRCK